MTIPCPLCGVPFTASEGAAEQTCPTCGHRFAGSPALPVSPSPVPPVSPSPAPPVASPSAPKTKSPTTAVLLCLLVCCMPLGHFYLGQTVKGFVWLGISVVTLGLGGFGAALDAWMCAKKMQRGGTVKEMEFFPQN